MAGRRGAELERDLQRFADAVAEAAGKNLVALVLYGSAAAGHHTTRSDVNLLLILRDAGAAALRPLGSALRDWVRGGERPPLIFSERGWRSAADVFPIEIEDIRARHRVLRGANPVADLATTPDDLRRQLEREARGLLVQLRASYAAGTSDGRALSAVVADSLGSVLALFRALLRMKDVEVPEDRVALVSAAAALAGFDASAFDWPLAQRGAARPARLAANDPAAARYVDAVAGFVDFIDRS